MDQVIITKEIDSILVITINRPKVYNALDKITKLEIQKTIESADTKKVKAIVLTGEGKAFCTGQDLNDRASSPSGKRSDLGETLNTEWNPLVKAIKDSPLPIVAAINGVTAGAGVSVALSCDLILARKEVVFHSGFVKIGLCPDAGSNHILTRSLGRHAAMNFFLGSPLSAQTLFNSGIICAIEDNLLDKAIEKARDLTALPPLAVAAIKKMSWKAWENKYDENIGMEVENQRRLGMSDDFQEGVQAFLEKRAPNFQGK